MQLNQSSDYAIRCMLYLADHHGFSSSQEICEAVPIGREYAHKLLRKMRDGELVVSEVGKDGGYALAREPSEISLLDIVLLTEDSMQVSRRLECPPIRDLSSRLEQNLLRFYQVFQDKLETALGRITLENLLDGNVEE